MLINSPNISGSLTVTGNSVITGSLTVLGSITGAITGSATTASYVEYSNVANKPTLVSGSSQVTYSGLTGIPSGIVSGSAQVTYSGLTGIPSGIVSGSAQIASFGIFATTGSNGFNGSQSITGSLTVTGQVVAQTLNVQQVTSSIVYSSGSNVFGNSLGNTQQFTGSLQVSGSSHYLLGSVGIGTTNPAARLQIIRDGVGSSNTSLDGSQLILSRTVGNAENIAFRNTGASNGISGTNYAGQIVSYGNNILEIYTNVSNPIIFGTEATERMRITPSGSIEIGTTGISSPSGADRFIGVYGAQDSSLILQDNVQTWELYVNDDFYINRGSTNVLTLNRTSGAATFSSSVTAGSSSATNYGTLQIMGGVTSASLTVGTAANTVLAFSAGQELAITGNNAAPYGISFQGRNSLAGGGASGTAYPLLLNPLGGNVGINTASPSEKLEVQNGYLSTYQDLNVNDAGYGVLFYTNGGGSKNSLAAITLSQVGTARSGNLLFATSNAGAPTTKMIITSTGNVGIGTASPLGNLEVQGANRAIGSDGILQVNSNNSQAIDLGGSISFGGVWTGTSVTEWASISGRKENSTAGQYGGYLSLGTRPHLGVITERMRINSAGDIVYKGSSTTTNAQTYIENTNTDLIFYASLTSGISKNIKFFYNGGTGEGMRITSGGALFNKAATAGHTAFIGAIGPGNVGNRYLHVRINTIQNMMVWIKVFGYAYTVGNIEGLSGCYIDGGTGSVAQSYQNGSIVAQHQNSNYLEIVVDTVSTATTNRWGSISFMGGTDNLTTIQPLEIIAYSWTSTTTRVY